MAKNRQLAAKAKTARQQARYFVELENDKQGVTSYPADQKRACVAALARYRAGLQEDKPGTYRIISTHW